MGADLISVEHSAALQICKCRDLPESCRLGHFGQLIEQSSLSLDSDPLFPPYIQGLNGAAYTGLNRGSQEPYTGLPCVASNHRKPLNLGRFWACQGPI